jgi:uncharacterized protein
MSYYFFDSSALAKRYIAEVGSLWIEGLTKPSLAHRLFVAQILQAEIMSAVARRVREKTLSPRTAHAIRLYLTRHMRREYNAVPFSPTVNERTLDLLEKYVLRAADAMQLASALEVHTRLLTAKLPSLVFVSADIRLLTAAVGEGLTIDDPNQHP